MKVQKNIEVRLLKKRLTSPVVDVVQYDTGVQLVFSLVDFDIPSGTTATLYVQKRSGKFVYQEKDITVSGNQITIDLENQALTEHGETKYQIMLKNGTDTVTTFAGVLRIEKSLADANAVESKTVVRAFDEAVADHVAEFQTKAEQIVQACIATLPDNYTAMEAKVNDLANAVKGYLSGAVVAADDVSTVEHNPAVKVKSKNHFNIANFSTEKDHSNGKTICAISADNLVIGRTYTVFSAVPMQWFKISNSATGYSCAGLQKDDVGFTSYTFTHQRHVNIPESAPLYIYVNNLAKTAMYDTAIMESMGICIVEGSVATDYIPYIDPFTVTVKRTSKNLIDRELMQNSVTLNGVTITRSGDQINLNGTLTVDSVLFNTHFCFHGGLGNHYTLSYKHTGGTVTGTASVCVGDSETFDSARQSWANIKMQNSDNAFSYPMTKPFIKDLWFYAMAGVVFNNYKIRIQLEPGKKATGFETCNSAVYVPTDDGTVSGLTSLSPNMTILTDTEGVIVECEYNRDTNKVIEKLTNAIIALGGTV